MKRLRIFVKKWVVTFDIEVDGGINANNIDNAINAGANIIVAGTAVFNDDIEGSVRSLMR